MIEKIYRTVKKAIRREQLADPFTISMYRFSPYHACEHGCSYCDGRAEKYYVDGVFDRDIIIRENEPELLELELPKLRERAPIGIGSGVTDVYQPVEVNERLMRRCGISSRTTIFRCTSSQNHPSLSGTLISGSR